jgi:putative FmdB family regulatory protein
MPLWDFQCSTCGTTREYLVASYRVSHVVCKTCGGLMEKQPAAPAFVLKGPGFFRTDYNTGERHKVEE